MDAGYKYLLEKGYTNKHSVDFGDLPTIKTTELKGFCLSELCTQNTFGSFKEIRAVRQSMYACPDCGHAIFWRRVNKEGYDG